MNMGEELPSLITGIAIPEPLGLLTSGVTITAITFPDIAPKSFAFVN